MLLLPYQVLSTIPVACMHTTSGNIIVGQPIHVGQSIEVRGSRVASKDLRRILEANKHVLGPCQYLMIETP
jgi:hypothetical protein